jgi:hypothetical protein
MAAFPAPETGVAHADQLVLVGLWPDLLVVPAIVLQPTLVLAPARRPAERGVAGRRKNFWQGVERADRRSTRR